MPEVINGRENKEKTQWLLMLAVIFFILLITTAAGCFIFEKIYQDKIYPNIFLGNLNLGGLTTEQAQKLVNQEVDKINQRGIIFSYKNDRITVRPVVVSTDADLAIQIINFNAEKTADLAIAYGRDSNFFINLEKKISLLLSKKRLYLNIFIDQGRLEKILKDNFTFTYEPAKDASLIIKPLAATGDYEISVAGEKLGKTIDYETILGQLISNLSYLNPAEIKLTTITQYPKILAKDSLNIESKTKAILNSAPLTLKYGTNKWALNRDELAELLALKPSGSAINKVSVGLDVVKASAYLAEQVAPKIDIKPIEAKFEFKNGKVAEFQNGQNGISLDIAGSLMKIENEITSHNEIDLEVKVQPILITAGNINSYGIKEIIGIGTSTFAGSPVNRRHNIKVGADSVNGTLVKPEEEFSLLKTLGEVTGSTGYLPELVIKEGKTLPEYGGGLCQIGTTVFRAVIASGLPVTMRRNHSYRVQYYEPAGTDATIYDPWPDFRFINDTANYILIQAKISGDVLSFEFWGTRDGRLVEKTKPTIYNIVKPEPGKIIETLDLKPGEKKCTEKAHNGADAYFDYKVIYANGQIKEKRFSSHYVPWQEVCLLGVEKLSAPPETATSTPVVPETAPVTN
jgi:vancomycin resistance protein YoaR